LSAGELRFRLQIGMFQPMRTPTSRLRRDAASSFVAGFRWRVEQFALSTPLPDVTVFSCDSFSLRSSGPAWEESRSSHWLRTPCALRLREPNRNDVTSDALCHTTGLTQELQLPPSPTTRSPHLAMKPASDLRRARIRSPAACLRPLYTAPRTPSVGLMSNLAMGPSSYAIIVRSRARAPHPFERREPALLVREEPPRHPTLRLLGSPRGSPRLHREDASNRPLQPTLDTSTRIIARFPRPRLAPRRQPPQ
jgi:hypothetical protein